MHMMVMHVARLELELIVGSSLLFLSLLFPSVQYAIAKISSKTIIKPASSDFYPRLTVFLPMKNEINNAKTKIEQVFSMEYPQNRIQIVVLDSSNDGTFEIAKSAVRETDEVLKIEKKGKSAAINVALDMVKTDFFVVMDSDSKCAPNSLSELMQWFSDEKIGAVCAHQGGEVQNLGEYRRRFNTIRIGESVLDSTPIFEGSLCCFRTTAIGKKRLNEKINADDSQMAIITRLNGYKSVMDPEVYFEQIGRVSRTRLVRRSQGILRVLSSNFNQCLVSIRYAMIFSSTLFFYSLMPWMFILGISLVILVLSYETQLLPPGYVPEFIETSIFVLPLFLFKTSRHFLYGISILLEAQIRLLAGNTLEIWDTER